MLVKEKNMNIIDILIEGLDSSYLTFQLLAAHESELISKWPFEALHCIYIVPRTCQLSH